MSGKPGSLNLGIALEKEAGAINNDSRRDDERGDYNRRYDHEDSRDGWRRDDGGRDGWRRDDGYQRDSYRRRESDYDRRPREDNWGHDSYRRRESDYDRRSRYDDDRRSRYDDDRRPREDNWGRDNFRRRESDYDRRSRYDDDRRSRYDDDRRPRYGRHDNYNRRDDGERREPFSAADNDDNWRRKDTTSATPSESREEGSSNRGYASRFNREDNIERRDSYNRRPHYERRDSYNRYPNREDDDRRPKFHVDDAVSIHKNENAFAALDTDSDEDDSNLSLEELKKRAAEKNHKAEEEKRKAIEERDRALAQQNTPKVIRAPVVTQSMREAENVEEPVDLELQWTVDLPIMKGSINLVSFPESKQTALTATMNSMFTNKKNNDMTKWIEDCKESEIASVLYRIFNYALRASNSENRYIYVLIGLLNNIHDFAPMHITESALQQCYLDASKTIDLHKDSPKTIDAFKANFITLVKILADSKLIEHVPSFCSEEDVKEVKEEVKKEVVEEKPVEQDAIDPALEKQFIAILETNALGTELTDKIMDANIAQDTRLMSTLLKFIIGNSNPSDFIKAKGDIVRFIPFQEKKYGDMLINLYDNCELEVHLELMNEIIRYWASVGMPQDLLEACFYSLFEETIVYDDCLQAWNDQDKDELLSKAVIRLNNIFFKIQEVVDARQDEE